MPHRYMELPNIKWIISVMFAKWPRLEKGRKVRCWLGGQLLFFWGYFPCFINPYMSDGKRRGGCLGSLSCRVSLWGDDSRSYNAPGLIPIFSDTPRKYTYSLPKERSSDYKNILLENSNNVEFSKS